MYTPGREMGGRGERREEAGAKNSSERDRITVVGRAEDIRSGRGGVGLVAVWMGGGGGMYLCNRSRRWRLWLPWGRNLRVEVGS